MDIEFKLLVMMMVALFAVFLAVLTMSNVGWGEEWTTVSQDVSYYFIAFVTLVILAFTLGQALRRR